MKKKYVILFTAILFIACKQQEPKTDYTLLSIQANNAKNAIIELYSSSTREKVKDIHLDENGFSKDTLRGLEKGEYVCGDGRKTKQVYVYVKNNSEVEIAYNYTNLLEPPTIGGINSLETKYLNEKKVFETNFLASGPDIWSYDPSKFMKTFIQFEKDGLAILEKYKDQIEPDYYKTKVGDIKYGTFLIMGNFESIYKGELPETFIKKQQEANLNDEFLFKNSQTFGTYMYNSLAYASNKFGKTDKRTMPLKVMDKINDDISNDYVKGGMLSNALEMFLVNTEDKKALYNKFITYCTNAEFKEKGTTFYKDVMKLEPGSPSPKFVNYESATGEKVSLDDLKGKYVFFDCWATWCAPCIKEIPFIKEIEKEYHGKNIAFVGLSFDAQKDKDKWKAMVKEKGLDAEHQLLADNALKSQFTQEYKIFTIPRFILLDPEGNIVDNDAPRSSQPELRTLLNSLEL
ncbi:TlpA family protein disulfide reductase [Flavivirga spongiicola]|uniref:TlpA family protein disulfide reductase n=1 Tax=Flavivirga spongiicola TaxID=421621 RepID=A0ABU7XYD9_9FLAO|nr:TlpA disulfide reductase family protein [Flavivirga sp. MEBiC05379]MDO5980816.1 TlpA disulfide reductase family protein [Flavivirga sp. MEBiC05379]